MVANKTDVVPYESLPAHTRAAIEEVVFCGRTSLSC